MKILVCGAGSIGKRHIKNLKSLGVEVLAWRSRGEISTELAEEYRIEVYTSIDEAMENADAVVVATATDTHIVIASKAVSYNKPVFIEKPLSDTYDNIANFLESIPKNHIIEIGFQLRAHPNLIKLHELIKNHEFGDLYTYRAVVGQRLDEWRPGVDYRKSYSANRTRGGGALLDLTHEIDLIRWLTGPIQEVSGNLASISDLEIDAEDLVNLILVNKSGAVGQIQLDMLSPVYRRSLELVFQKAILHWDAVQGVLQSKSPEGVLIEHKVLDEFDRNDMFVYQMRHFINRIKNNIEPLCSLQSGVDVQKIVQAARQSYKLKKSIEVDQI